MGLLRITEDNRKWEALKSCGILALLVVGMDDFVVGDVARVGWGWLTGHLHGVYWLEFRLEAGGGKE